MLSVTSNRIKARIRLLLKNRGICCCLFVVQQLDLSAAFSSETYTSRLHATLDWPLCNTFSKFLSVSLEFVIGLCLGAGKCLLPSAIKLYCDAVCRIQGVAETWRKPLWDWSLLSGRIVNLISEYKITHQTLRVSRWNSLPPVCLPTTVLHSASKGDHLSWLVNFSWSFPHSMRPVSGEDGCQSVRG